MEAMLIWGNSTSWSMKLAWKYRDQTLPFFSFSILSLLDVLLFFHNSVIQLMLHLYGLNGWLCALLGTMKLDLCKDNLLPIIHSLKTKTTWILPTLTKSLSVNCKTQLDFEQAYILPQQYHNRSTSPYPRASGRTW